MSVLMWNDKFELHDGSYSASDILDYFDYIIKKHKTLIDNPPMRIEMELQFALKLCIIYIFNAWSNAIKAIKFICKQH